MEPTTIRGPAWIPRFLDALAKTGVVKEATRMAGVTSGAVYFQKNGNADFARAWDAALGGELPDGSASPAAIVARPAARNGGWTRRFLEVLAATSNVTHSAREANVPVSTAYALRRNDPDFAARWRAALHEGYRHLEMEVLASLRGGPDAPRLDVPNAIRMLAHHRQSAAEMRAQEDGHDEARAVRRTIDAMIARVRQDEGLPPVARTIEHRSGSGPAS